MISSEQVVENFPKNIFIIGVGGTGARIAEELKFFLRTAYSFSRELVRCRVHLIDHDPVEWKNTERQPFQPSNIGYPKSFVKAQYLKQFIQVTHVPEPINQDSIGQIFTPEVLADNFLVISAVDNKPTRAMVYHYLREHATRAEDKTWMWIFSGGDLRKQQLEVNSLFGQTVEHDLPFVTNLCWGYHKGNPTNPLMPHERFIGEFPDLEGAYGMTHDNEIVGCGLAPEDEIRQSYTMNNMASVLTMYMLDSIYYRGVIIDQMTFMNGKTDAVVLGNLEDLTKELSPEVIEEIETNLGEPDEASGLDMTPSSFERPEARDLLAEAMAENVVAGSGLSQGGEVVLDSIPAESIEAVDRLIDSDEEVPTTVYPESEPF